MCSLYLLNQMGEPHWGMVHKASRLPLRQGHHNRAIWRPWMERDKGNFSQFCLDDLGTADESCSSLLLAEPSTVDHLSKASVRGPAGPAGPAGGSGWWQAG